MSCLMRLAYWYNSFFNILHKTINLGLEDLFVFLEKTKHCYHETQQFPSLGRPSPASAAHCWLC